MASEIADEFNAALKAEFIRQIGERPEENEEYPKLISEKVFDKCEAISAQYRDKIIFGEYSANPSSRHFGFNLKVKF